ncbi:hypothetical protein SAMN05428944_3891 [Streptomyces sp. 1222.5]|uniref:hypothetical protein n=1 Tax=unclassified Streptomyces TaxID=2593676 RepID=UPI00089470BA|nr:MULTISPECIES: hypothetical protein [unclassified Streptomyces]PKW08965.1 hypothetical protein BX260_4203 [Streptomyces sp. 5112.2]SEC48300.1 hypothetical protein SAMN05428944_3891 [Streptomyces sp. 1222.5]SED40682.1 hypothetical protein SAMN05216532_4456 [Streptomyces sp. 2231.1]
MRSLTARLAERDARLARLAKRNPKTHDDYRNALAKVRYLRGEASEHACALCAAPAAEWQLTFLDQREGPQFFLWSDDVHDYWPYCPPCSLDAETLRRKALDRIWYPNR